jgi:hypothetical protein
MTGTAIWVTPAGEATNIAIMGKSRKANIMKTLNSPDIKLETMDAQTSSRIMAGLLFNRLTAASREKRSSSIPGHVGLEARTAPVSPNATNAFSDDPRVWRADAPQPFTAIWGCRAKLP